MRSSFSALVFGLTFLLQPLSAAPAGAAVAADAAINEVRAADDRRVAAIISADAAALRTILSDELRYAHSSGSIDTKATFIDALTARRVSYETIDYSERTFRPAGTDVMLMTGRCTARVRSNGQPLTLELGFLSVWRKENGQWCFLAWQSARLPAPSNQNSK